MKTLFKIIGVLLLVVVVFAAGVYGWASITTSRMRAHVFRTHAVDFLAPFPLDPAEVASRKLSEDAARQLALDRAIARGQHLVSSRYTCGACHGDKFGGGVMVDAFPIGRLLAPNLTLGAGSRTAEYQPHDWDRIVRHGVLPNGRPALMPSVDFQQMSDQELSDIVAYVRSLPPVNNTVPAPTLGPLGTILVATGQIKLSAPLIASHETPHEVYPPAETAGADFGKHMASICVGCHGPKLSGGPIEGGDPSWPPARNLTPDATGLKGWTYDQFVTAITESQRPDGTALRSPMKEMSGFAKNMTDTERQALWGYLQSLPPVSNTVGKK